MTPHARFDVLCINQPRHPDKIFVDVNDLFSFADFPGDAVYAFVGVILREFRSPPSEEFDQLASNCFVFLAGRVAVGIETRKQQIECLSR